MEKQPGLVEFGLRPAIVAHGTKGRGQVSQEYCITVKQRCLFPLIWSHGHELFMQPSNPTTFTLPL